MLVFHNPAKFKNSLLLEDVWQKPEENTYEADEFETFLHLKGSVSEDTPPASGEAAADNLTPPGSAFGLRSDINH